MKESVPHTCFPKVMVSVEMGLSAVTSPCLALCSSLGTPKITVPMGFSKLPCWVPTPLSVAIITLPWLPLLGVSGVGLASFETEGPAGATTPSVPPVLAESALFLY